MSPGQRSPGYPPTTRAAVPGRASIRVPGQGTSTRAAVPGRRSPGYAGSYLLGAGGTLGRLPGHGDSVAAGVPLPVGQVAVRFGCDESAAWWWGPRLTCRRLPLRSSRSGAPVEREPSPTLRDQQGTPARGHTPSHPDATSSQHSEASDHQQHPPKRRADEASAHEGQLTVTHSTTQERSSTTAKR